MFKCFRLELRETKNMLAELYDNDYDKFIDACFSYDDYCRSFKREISDGLHKYIDGGVLKASKIILDWFPNIQADVFLSHSHHDEKLIIGLASWFYSIGIKAFVDSEVWNYCDELLRKIDNKYCTADNNLYSYEKRNSSTSHVHMLLNTAITQMIDDTECFIFVGTNNSLSMNPETIKDGRYSTKSAWIYSEISVSRVIRQNIPERLEGIIPISEAAGPEIDYDLDMNHLCRLYTTDLKNIQEDGFTGTEALDELYRVKNLIS